MPSGSLGSDLRFMRRLNRRVFLLDLMEFAVNAGSKGVTDLADGFICLKLQMCIRDSLTAFGMMTRAMHSS